MKVVREKVKPTITNQVDINYYHHICAFNNDWSKTLICFSLLLNATTSVAKNDSNHDLVGGFNPLKKYESQLGF